MNTLNIKQSWGFPNHAKPTHPHLHCAGFPGFGYIRLCCCLGSMDLPVTYLSLLSKTEVSKVHTAQLLSGRASAFPSLFTSRHLPAWPWAAPPLPPLLYLSLLQPSGTHSIVFWESQYKEWESELVMVTRLVCQGCVLHQAHDYQHLHTPQCAHTHCIVSRSSEPLCESES